MTSYAEMARERKKARSLYLELRALGLELYAKEDPYDATGYRVRVVGLHIATGGPRRADKAESGGEQTWALEGPLWPMGPRRRGHPAGRDYEEPTY